MLNENPMEFHKLNGHPVALGAVATVCLLAAAVIAAPRIALPIGEPISVAHFHSTRRIKEDKPTRCQLKVSVGSRQVKGELPVNISVAPCTCLLEMQVLQQNDIPVTVGGAWYTAFERQRAEHAVFPVVVAGMWRAVADCGQGGFFDHRLTLNGVNPVSWNVELDGRRNGSSITARVGLQYSSGDNDSYFPQLYVSLYKMSSPGGDDNCSVGSWRRQLLRNMVVYNPNRTQEVHWQHEVVGSCLLQVDVRPANSWVCQGNNYGCQRRWAYVQDS